MYAYVFETFPRPLLARDERTGPASSELLAVLAGCSSHENLSPSQAHSVATQS